VRCIFWIGESCGYLSPDSSLSFALFGIRTVA
jgi:hypothetical protein